MREHIERRRRDFGCVVIGEMRDELRATQAQTGFAQHGGALGRWNMFAERAEPQPARRKQPCVPTGGLCAQQVDQLAVLRPPRHRIGSAVAQHGGKAVIKLHGGRGHSGAYLARTSEAGGQSPATALSPTLP